MLGQAIGKVHETQQASTQLANAFEIGKSGVDLPGLQVRQGAIVPRLRFDR